MKTCSICGESKEFQHFTKRAASSDGCTPHCKVCGALKRKEYNRGKGFRTEMDLPVEKKKDVYTAVIIRMRQQGLTSEHTTNKMLDRVGAL